MATTPAPFTTTSNNNELDEEFNTISYQPNNKRRRHKSSRDQVDGLERAFQLDSKPSREIQDQLAADLGMSIRSIQIWFQNRRAKARSAGVVLPPRPLHWKTPMMGQATSYQPQPQTNHHETTPVDLPSDVVGSVSLDGSNESDSNHPVTSENNHHSTGITTFHNKIIPKENIKFKPNSTPTKIRNHLNNFIQFNSEPTQIQIQNQNSCNPPYITVRHDNLIEPTHITPAAISMVSTTLPRNENIFSIDSLVAPIEILPTPVSVPKLYPVTTREPDVDPIPTKLPSPTPAYISQPTKLTKHTNRPRFYHYVPAQSQSQPQISTQPQPQIPVIPQSLPIPSPKLLRSPSLDSLTSNDHDQIKLPPGYLPPPPSISTTSSRNSSPPPPSNLLPLENLGTLLADKFNNYPLSPPPLPNSASLLPPWTRPVSPNVTPTPPSRPKPSRPSPSDPTPPTRRRKKLMKSTGTAERAFVVPKPVSLSHDPVLHPNPSSPPA